MPRSSQAITYYQQVQEAAEKIRSAISSQPTVGFIFGTGMSPIGEEIELDASFSYDDLPHFPESTVQSHSGEIVVGHLSGVPVIACLGRFHLYEGYDPKEVTFPVRVLHEVGVNALFSSNAAGGMNRSYSRGDLVMVTDHINLQGVNPLEGPNVEEWGPRFPDMSEPYDANFQEYAREIAAEEGIPLGEGVYVAVEGPNLETRAEYRFLGELGGDLVGMSTVPEVIVARHMGMRVFVLSVVTDECFPDALEPIDVEAVFAALDEVRPSAMRLLTRLVKQVK